VLALRGGKVDLGLKEKGIHNYGGDSEERALVVKRERVHLMTWF